jgi:hypothetical protein
MAITYALYIGIGVSRTIHWFSDFAAGAIIGSAKGAVVGKSFWRSQTSLVQSFFDEPCFNPRPRPRCFAQKRKTGLYARIELKTTDRDAMSHLSPAMPRDQFFNDAFQRDAVQWIAGM